MAIGYVDVAGDMATLTFPRTLLEQLGILADNQIQSSKIQVDIVNQMLVARKIVESERAEKVNNAIDHVFETYDDVFIALAEGAK
ncbi:MAG: hypothetical protein AAF639_26660 [Chloroflexota bacterium]